MGLNAVLKFTLEYNCHVVRAHKHFYNDVVFNDNTIICMIVIGFTVDLN